MLGWPGEIVIREVELDFELDKIRLRWTGLGLGRLCQKCGVDLVRFGRWKLSWVRLLY